MVAIRQWGNPDWHGTGEEVMVPKDYDELRKLNMDCRATILAPVMEVPKDEGGPPDA